MWELRRPVFRITRGKGLEEENNSQSVLEAEISFGLLRESKVSWWKLGAPRLCKEGPVAHQIKAWKEQTAAGKEGGQGAIFCTGRFFSIGYSGSSVTVLDLRNERQKKAN